MKIRNFLSHLFFFAAIAFTPLLASASSGESTSEAAHQNHGLNWFDFSAEGSQPLVAILFNFAALILIVYFIMRRPLGQKFKNRQETLVKALEEAREAKAKAEKALADARAKMDAMDSEMKRIKKELIEAGEAESSRITEEAARRAKRLLADTETLAEQEILRMVQGIREEIVQEVVARAEQIIREKVTSEDHDRLASDYLEGMGARPSIMPTSMPPSPMDGQ